ncbi:hypothetical protein C9439_07065 [archaeon SCG-AAA382B04]|nr:hypothetical protein C9439_07065 [archaeon SCG-AAA382B04]
MALKSRFSVQEVASNIKRCPECKEKGYLAFINDRKGTGMRCDNCGSRLEFVAQPQLKIKK